MEGELFEILEYHKFKHTRTRKKERSELKYLDDNTQVIMIVWQQIEISTVEQEKTRLTEKQTTQHENATKPTMGAFS